jgi:hypothetical protein
VTTLIKAGQAIFPPAARQSNGDFVRFVVFAANIG